MEKEDLKDQRVQVMFTKRDLEMIDDWAAAYRIRSRGEAIRRLCARSLLKDKKKIQDMEMRRYMYEEE